MHTNCPSNYVCGAVMSVHPTPKYLTSFMALVWWYLYIVTLKTTKNCTIKSGLIDAKLYLQCNIICMCCMYFSSGNWNLLLAWITQLIIRQGESCHEVGVSLCVFSFQRNSREESSSFLFFSFCQQIKQLQRGLFSCNPTS